MTRSYRIRAYPNGAQRRLLDRWIGAVRWLWNTSRDIRAAAYSEYGLSLTGVDISRWVTQWKRTPDHEWLADVPSTCLTQCLRDRYFASSKTCSCCGHVIDALRLDQREWTCPKCRTDHDRDVNAARSILHEALRRVAGCDDRDLRVDARGACSGHSDVPVQVLADEA